jgi:hypothetical protein
MAETPETSSMGLGTKVVIGALAAFGAISLVSWLFSRVIGFVKLGLFIAVCIAIIAVVMKAKMDRADTDA